MPDPRRLGHSSSRAAEQPWSITSSTLAEGTYAMPATATVGASTSVASGALSVTIDTTGPTISSISSTDAGGTAGLAQKGDSISVTFNEAVVDSAPATETMSVCAKNGCAPHISGS